MFFSIIIPAYNSENYIHKALDSIQQQSFRDYELIVVCDNCVDNTYEIACEYADKVYQVDFSNDGMARNCGIDNAKGRYILFMDDDDWFLHEFVLEMLHDKLKSYKSKLDILCFGFIYAHKGYAQPSSQRFNHGNQWTAVWNKCWRRTAIGKTRFPEVEMCSDRYFNNTMFKKVLKKSLTVVDWDMPLYYYNYMRTGSQTEKANRRNTL